MNIDFERWKACYRELDETLALVKTKTIDSAPLLEEVNHIVEKEGTPCLGLNYWRNSIMDACLLVPLEWQEDQIVGFVCECTKRVIDHDYYFLLFRFLPFEQSCRFHEYWFDSHRESKEEKQKAQEKGFVDEMQTEDETMIKPRFGSLLMHVLLHECNMSTKDDIYCIGLKERYIEDVSEKEKQEKNEQKEKEGKEMQPIYYTWDALAKHLLRPLFGQTFDLSIHSVHLKNGDVYSYCDPRDEFELAGMELLVKRPAQNELIEQHEPPSWTFQNQNQNQNQNRNQNQNENEISSFPFSTEIGGQNALYLPHGPGQLVQAAMPLLGDNPNIIHFMQD